MTVRLADYVAETLVRSTGLPLRQLGDQEIDITAVVASITKYAVIVTDPKTIRYHLEKAIHLAASGRPGPVWLDIPINVHQCPGAIQNEEAAFLKAVELELSWLKNKKAYYGAIHREDDARLAMMEERYRKSIDAIMNKH